MKYKRQRIICVALLTYYEDLTLTGANDNKKLWKTVKPLFGNKAKGKSQTAVV